MRSFRESMSVKKRVALPRPCKSSSSFIVHDDEMRETNAPPMSPRKMDTTPVRQTVSDRSTIQLEVSISQFSWRTLFSVADGKAKTPRDSERERRSGWPPKFRLRRREQTQAVDITKTGPKAANLWQTRSLIEDRSNWWQVKNDWKTSCFTPRSTTPSHVTRLPQHEVHDKQRHTISQELVDGTEEREDTTSALAESAGDWTDEDTTTDPTQTETLLCKQWHSSIRRFEAAPPIQSCFLSQRILSHFPFWKL